VKTPAKNKRIVDSSDEKSLEDDFNGLGVSRGRKSRKLKRAPISEDS